MPEESAFEESLAALSQFFVGGRTMEETLQRVSEMSVEALPAAEFVGITMMKDGRPQTGVFTDLESPEIDESQYRTGSGPCLDSFRTGELMVIDDTRTDERWPSFNEACIEHGILSTMSHPLTVDGQTNGALNVYSRTAKSFGTAQIRTGQMFAAQAAVVLANATAYWSARSRAEQLQEALVSRAVIEQAKGIIMSSTRCSPDEAFEVLVKQSQQQNRKLREIAQEIVTIASRRA